MTNNWTDIGNSSCVLVMGANPSENHPACMAHINRARDRGAKLIVVDPRQTRTARQADKYIRIRPGTDIAFTMALTKYIIEQMEDPTSSVPAATKTAFFSFLNDTSAGTFFADEGGAGVPVAGVGKYSDARFILKADGTDYDREVYELDATHHFTNFPKRAATVDADPNTVYNRLKQHVAPYDLATSADICGCTEADIIYVANAYIANSRCSSVGNDPTIGPAGGYRALTHLYAMGLTQHTKGAQNIKSFAVLQSMMGNMGRAGGGINALRGIHNVQGSTDMGLLYHLIPGYSGNPTLMPSGGVTVSNDANAFGKYMDGLWGNPLSGTGTRTTYNGSYDDAYVTGAMGLQQRGFWNMTQKFFGDTSCNDRTRMDAIYALWPKTNGDDHITMFRKMIAGDIKACMVWGQNPAVTEPNQGKIRAGLKELDLLVVADLFETETAATDRKATGVTYLIPTASHVEEAGSVTNSGRVLQWRERTTTPRGNTKSDLELLLRFAKALDDNSGFSHISDVWDSLAVPLVYTSVYDKLYGAPYGWTPGVDGDFELVSGTAEIWHGDDAAPTTGTVYGSEWVSELMFREMATNTNAGGTLWIYTLGYSTTRTGQQHTGQAAWAVDNRAKSRINTDPNGTFAFPAWGYAWLVNRRVLYNNGDIPGDVADYYMGPDSVARLFVSKQTAVLNYSRWYRKVHNMSDRPDVVLANQLTSPHFQGGVAMAGRFPGHTEPYETPRADLAATWGRNTRGNAAWELVKTDTDVAGRDVPAADYPLVLTTIRCVEHFQGGPITRNNPWNVEAEPEPWIELNSLDAAAMGIVSGDLVNVTTARGNSIASQNAITTGAPFAKGFVARVGVGLQTNQRVGQGVVAIPWHWGDRGLSTGSRANDLCIDAGDANTTIPESKACLCKIEKA